MTTDDELPPDILSELRNIPAVDDALREQHIATALAELRSGQSKKRRVFVAVAAAVVLIIGGVTIARNSPAHAPAIAAPDTTMLSSLPKGSADCAKEFSGLWGDSRGLGSFTTNEVNYAVIGHNGELSVFLASSPCSKVGNISYWNAMVERGKEESVASTQQAVCSYTSEPIARFDDRANGATYSFVLIQTATGVSLHFEDRCNEPLGSLSVP